MTNKINLLAEEGLISFKKGLKNSKIPVLNYDKIEISYLTNFFYYFSRNSNIFSNCLLVILKLYNRLYNNKYLNK